LEHRFFPGLQIQLDLPTAFRTIKTASGIGSFSKLVFVVDPVPSVCDEHKAEFAANFRKGTM